jgi:hypothetical protein
MYQDNAPQVLGAAVTSVGGIAVLPATGDNIIFTVAAYAAIVIGVTTLALQVMVAIYRIYSRSK